MEVDLSKAICVMGSFLASAGVSILAYAAIETIAAPKEQTIERPTLWWTDGPTKEDVWDRTFNEIPAVDPTRPIRFRLSSSPDGPPTRQVAMAGGAALTAGLTLLATGLVGRRRVVGNASAMATL